jgi:hypothetical protein
VDDGLGQLGQVEPPPPDGRADQEVEVPREEEGGQRGDDVGEQQNGEKGEQDDAEHLAGQQAPEIGHVPDIA